MSYWISIWNVKWIYTIHVFSTNYNASCKISQPLQFSSLNVQYEFVGVCLKIVSTCWRSEFHSRWTQSGHIQVMKSELTQRIGLLSWIFPIFQGLSNWALPLYKTLYGGYTWYGIWLMRLEWSLTYRYISKFVMYICESQSLQVGHEFYI